MGASYSNKTLLKQLIVVFFFCFLFLVSLTVLEYNFATFIKTKIKTSKQNKSSQNKNERSKLYGKLYFEIVTS